MKTIMIGGLLTALALVVAAEKAHAGLTTEELQQVAKMRAGTERERDIQHAMCRIDGYTVQASDIGGYVFACMRINGWILRKEDYPLAPASYDKEIRP